MPLFMSILIFITIVVVLLWVWDGNFRKIPLHKFGIEAVQRALTWEPEAYRVQIWERGWMTSNEWINLLERQNAMIEAELKRRGID